MNKFEQLPSFLPFVVILIGMIGIGVLGRKLQKRALAKMARNRNAMQNGWSGEALTGVVDSGAMLYVSGVMMYIGLGGAVFLAAGIIGVTIALLE